MQEISAEQSRRVDHYAQHQLGLPTLVLMENAAIGAADVAMGMIEARREQGLTADAPAVAILCGMGNNGGDGYALGRHLFAKGCAVALFAAGDPDQLPPDARCNAVACARMGLPIVRCDGESSLDESIRLWRKADLLIDALLGVGFSGEELREPVSSMLEGARQAVEEVCGGGCEGCDCASSKASPRRPWVLAIDVPSGFDSNRASASLCTLKAIATATFIGPKLGFAEASEHTGHVVPCGLGLPAAVITKALEEPCA